MAFAKNDVTKFLDIPVDGTKASMIHKLKQKGFSSSPYDKEVLTGTFNGANVNVHIATNNDRVCRIMVCDVNKVDERSIQIRFNTLCRQFENNDKYISFSDNQQIPDDEDISYGSRVKNKRYEAVFYQKAIVPEDSTTISQIPQEIFTKCATALLEKYSPEELINPSEEIRKEMENMAYVVYAELCMKKSVWFMISESYGKYYITMYYDNEYNRANGEDL